jgi:hypothetical protein
MTSLNLSDNNLGILVSPGGWSSKARDAYKYRHTDGRKTDTKPEGEEFKPEGIIALANAIPDMGALSLLNLTDNSIGNVRVQKIKEVCGSRNISLLIH